MVLVATHFGGNFPASCGPPSDQSLSINGCGAPALPHTDPGNGISGAAKAHVVAKAGATNTHISCSEVDHGKFGSKKEKGIFYILDVVLNIFWW